jgi:hypothetical protein
MVQLGEGVVLLHKAQTSADHLPGQPFVAVDIDLDGKREPGLNSHVQASEFRIEKVVVQHPLRAIGKLQPRPLAAPAQLDRPTRFLETEHGQQPFRVTTITSDPVDQAFLVVLALEITVRRARVVGHLLSVFDQLLRHPLHLGQEVLSGDSQTPVDEGVQVFVPSEGEVALENQAVVTGQSGYNGTSKLCQKRTDGFHGVLLQWMCGFPTPSN